MAIQKIYESQMQGSYTLERISLRDDAYRSNSIEYKADGTTQIWDSINSTWIYGEHDFDFTSETVSISEPIPSPDPQTDFTHPELTSFEVPEDGEISVRVGKHERIKFNYEAADVGSGINTVEFQFRNENNNTISLYDYDDDGIVSARMEDWYSEGTYQLYRIQLRDDASQQNRITFEKTELLNTTIKLTIMNMVHMNLILVPFPLFTARNVILKQILLLLSLPLLILFLFPRQRGIGSA